jgi:hypothetical protein
VSGPFFRAFLGTVAVTMLLWHANPVTVHAEDAATPRFKAIVFDIAFRIFTDDGRASRTFAIRDNSGNMIQFFGK